MEQSDQEHEGKYYLELLGLEHLIGQQVGAADGTIPAEDFLQVCGEHAKPLLVGLDNMDPSDPQYEDTREMLRGLVDKYIEGS